MENSSIELIQYLQGG